MGKRSVIADIRDVFGTELDASQPVFARQSQPA
jgi:hypothetical protein